MKNILWTQVFTAGFLFILPFISHAFGVISFSITDYVTFVGDTAGPIAALAGFLFVYINFQHQQRQMQSTTDSLKGSFLKTRIF